MFLCECCDSQLQSLRSKTLSCDIRYCITGILVTFASLPAIRPTTARPPTSQAARTPPPTVCWLATASCCQPAVSLRTLLGQACHWVQEYQSVLCCRGMWSRHPSHQYHGAASGQEASHQHRSVKGSCSCLRNLHAHFIYILVVALVHVGA